MYKLPDALRSELAQPMAPVRSTEEAIPLTQGKTLVSVGDVCTQEFLEHGVQPKLAILDGKTQRNEDYSDFVDAQTRDPDAHVLRVQNPAATLTRELDAAIRDALARAGTTLIIVDGEEDLATLPAIHHAPDDALVAYGQPNEGVVLVPVNADTRARVRDILDRMEVTP